VVASPKGEAGEKWGDTWFARDLADALRRQGQNARVVRTISPQNSDDVVLVLRGLKDIRPVRPPGTWMLWIISHPEDVSASEIEAFDAVFAASRHWSKAQSFAVPITPLLQATNPRRFQPRRKKKSGDVLFVGNTRGQFRPVVRDALAAGFHPAIFGTGWESYVEDDVWRGEYLDNMELPRAYAHADIVLNDHWSDMASEGFLSNRLFDATAAGARIVTDTVTGLDEVFGCNVRVYTNPEHLKEILRAPRDQVFGTDQQVAAEAQRIARDHSFDARAQILIDRAWELRERP